MEQEKQSNFFTSNNFAPKQEIENNLKQLIELYDLQSFTNDRIIIINPKHKNLDSIIFYLPTTQSIVGNQRALLDLNDSVRIIPRKDAKFLLSNGKFFISDLFHLEEGKNSFSVTTPLWNSSSRHLFVDIAQTESGQPKLEVYNGGGSPYRTGLGIRSFDNQDSRMKAYQEEIEKYFGRALINSKSTGTLPFDELHRIDRAKKMDEGASLV